MKDKSIGVLWHQTSRDGSSHFMSGNLEVGGVKHKIVVFENKNKKNPKAPDYSIYPARPAVKEAGDFGEVGNQIEDKIPF